MKRVFLDTNFLVDYHLREEYFSITRKMLRMGTLQGAQFYFSYLSLANYAYIARKLPREALDQALTHTLSLFKIIPNTPRQITKALQLNAKDFEDALQYEAAMDAGCDCIITRNAKDFSFAEIPVLSAAEYLDRYI